MCVCVLCTCNVCVVCCVCVHVAGFRLHHETSLTSLLGARRRRVCRGAFVHVCLCMCAYMTCMCSVVKVHICVCLSLEITIQYMCATYIYGCMDVYMRAWL